MLELNQRVELEVLDGEYAGTYLSRVEEIGEKDLRVAIPVEKGAIVPLRLKTPITVTFLGKDAVYSGDTFIIGRFIEPIPILVLLKPEEFRRIQRRSYVRVDTNLPVQIKVVEEQENEENEVNENLILGYSRNVSGGGLMVAVEVSDVREAKISLDTLLETSFEIPDVPTPIKAIGKVVRVDKQKLPKGTEEIVLGINFVSLEEKDREHVISYVFRRQRELRKLGLL